MFSEDSTSLIKDLCLREQDIHFNKRFKTKNVFSSHTVNHLSLYTELKGHDGCVNCLEWNRHGNILASGSDDLKIMLWDPFRNSLLNSIETKHRGNIFSVKFLPCSNDSLIASAAADRDIYVYDVNKNLTVNEIHTHQNRVKRLETASDLPFLFWSCGEDGLVLQHDIRCPPSSITSLLFNFTGNKILIGSKYLEVKCIAINPVRTELMAVGLNSPYARVYDRRMISLRSFLNRNTQTTSTTTTSSSINSYPNSSEKSLFEFCLNDEAGHIPLNYYVPGHLPKRIDEYRKRLKTLAITFIQFSPDGNELLVNLGGEQLYSFNLKEDPNPAFSIKYDAYRELLAKQPELDREETPTEHPSTTENDVIKISTKKKYKLPAKAEDLKQKANASFEEHNYIDAVVYYNKAIKIAPNSAILYGNRAATLIKRNWDGDIYEAMRDCYIALNLDRTHLKSHFRLAKCLNDLKWHREAKECLDIFVSRFPDYAKSQACDNLVNEISNELEKLRANEKKNKPPKRTRLGESFNENFAHLDSQSGEEEEVATGRQIKCNDDNKDDDNVGNDESSNEVSDDEAEDESEGDQLSSSNLKDKKQRAAKKKRLNKIESSSSAKKSTLKESDKANVNNNRLVKEYNELKESPIDFKKRYSGHCNVATDIKECNYLGENFVVAGSDDGSIFIWDRETRNIVRVLKGDESIVNCLQPHPYSCFLASSGIEPVIKIWWPKYDDKEGVADDEHVISDVRRAALENQSQMNSHPFEYLFMNLQNAHNWNEEDSSSGQQTVACRPS